MRERYLLSRKKQTGDLRSAKIAYFLFGFAVASIFWLWFLSADILGLIK